MDVLWRMALLGRLSLQGSSGDAHRLRLQRAGALLAYLALHPERRYSREALCEMLWPEEAPEAARNRLRVTLSSLRKQLEPPGTPFGAVLVADGSDSVGLRSEAIETDVADFETHLKRGDDAGAVALYLGPLLPGLYESWVFEERERLQDACLGALQRLARQRAESGDTDAALEYLRQAAAIAPLAEEVHAEIIRLLIGAGRPDAARRTYEHWEKRLREELDEEPPAEIRSLFTGTSTREPAGKKPVEPLRSPAPTPSPASAPAVALAPTLHLPVYLTRFFGRDEERKRLAAWLHDSDVRLITLTGLGGGGKTRLAVETARQESITSEGQRPIWFVPLVDVWDIKRIGEAIHQALSLPRDPKADPGEQVIAFLAAQPGNPLLVLDNFEQLSQEGAPVVASLLQRIPRLTCLATSRHRLNLPGEQELPLHPLTATSAEGTAPTPESLMEIPGIRLFVDRAQAARPDFQITPRNAADVAAICGLLEGIPLAVELAAARAGALAPAQMRARLSEGWDVPADRRARREDRHQSLRAALEWSYDLLSPDLRKLFVQLSVFRGGCDAEAAEAVCAEPQARDFLARLRATSLLTTEEQAGTIRFRMLETVRVWAQERSSLPERTELSARHFRYYHDRVEQAEPHLEGPDQTIWRDSLEADYPNLLAALDWAEIHDSVTGLQTATTLFAFWYKQGHIREGRERLDLLLNRAGKDTPLPMRAHALKTAGVLAFWQGDHEAARTHMEAGLKAAQDCGDRATEASLCNNLGLVAWQQGDLTRAQTLIGQTLAIRREQGDRWNETSALLNLGAVTRDRGEATLARQLFEESLAVSRETGDVQGRSRALNNLGNVLLAEEEQDLEAVRLCYEESAALKRELGDQRGLAVSLHNLASIMARQGDTDQARTLAEESLILRKAQDELRSVAFSLNLLGQIETVAGNKEVARGFLLEALILRRTMENLNDIGLSLFMFARLAITENQPERAASLLAASEFLRTGDAQGAPTLPPEERREFDICREEVRALLPAAAFEAAWAKGQAMSPAEAIDFTLALP